MASQQTAPLKIAIIGSGNWGSAIARIVGGNVAKDTTGKFDKTVRMWVFEEQVNGRKLTEIINTDHENVKYLPGMKLPETVVAVPDVVEAAKDADMLLFVIPHQFILRTCKTLAGTIKPTATALSLVKGLNSPEPGKIGLISDVIKEALGIECGVLMGANVANEVAAGEFCETTIAFRNRKGSAYRDAIQTENFRVSLINDVAFAELSGALKNIVAFGAGLIDGMLGEKGGNTKAAVIRIGIMEMIDFAEKFFPGGKRETFLESCGIADVITSSYGGRNRKVAAAFAANPDKTIKDLEAEMLNGQLLQGPGTAEEVNLFLKQTKREGEFPLFTAVHQICRKEIPVQALLDQLRNHPVHQAHVSL
ncbi:Glycerol-3-phosphate dehydrogenase [NAD(+)], cytoplasmic [Hypsibius exemplaris]|uniref:Glycerol-3-phosphate dehydrogenase [NAD(+)] n=1 Tax=Hypsibius exemplaris TaxID=2072580 RepID=A0A1W0WHS5_HYPEX|nr:Glycerol-3-phosphate dehydrogenase [NAD(+)], cytoplasmic [Hypsibius exemplaris]